LKLVGVVTGPEPRAVLTDGHGKGWVVRVGDDVAQGWRVERIGASDVWLVRTDAGTPAKTTPRRHLSL